MLEKIKKFKLPFTNKQIIYIFHIILIIIFFAILLKSYKHWNLDYWKAMKKYWEIAWYLLIYTIFSSLAFKLFKEFKIIQQAFILRKWAWIAVFYFAFLHLFFYFLNSNFSINYFLSDIKFSPITYISGLIAFILLLILFITSAKFLIKLLWAKKWKILHKATHLVFILVIIHIIAIKYPKIEWWIILLFIVYLLWYAYLFYKTKQWKNL